MAILGRAYSEIKDWSKVACSNCGEFNLDHLLCFNCKQFYECLNCCGCED